MDNNRFKSLHNKMGGPQLTQGTGKEIPYPEYTDIPSIQNVGLPMNHKEMDELNRHVSDAQSMANVGGIVGKTRQNTAEFFRDTLPTELGRVRAEQYTGQGFKNFNPPSSEAFISNVSNKIKSNADLMGKATSPEDITKFKLNGEMLQQSLVDNILANSTYMASKKDQFGKVITPDILPKKTTNDNLQALKKALDSLNEKLKVKPSDELLQNKDKVMKAIINLGS
jgi:hypothetical protein